MAQLEERLSSLLSDDEGRQQIIKLASMLGGSSSAEQTNTESSETSQTEPLDSPSGNTTATQNNDKTSAIFSILPSILQAMSGNGDGLDSKKVNLIRAISPYISSARSEYIDRAIRMASIAKIARDSLGNLGG